jgi:hypothetical protein
MPLSAGRSRTSGRIFRELKVIAETCYISVMGKSINIKNDEATALIAELTAETGKGTTELILELLRQEAEHRRKLLDVGSRRKRIDAIVSRARRKISKKAPKTESLIEYDRNGLPK